MPENKFTQTQQQQQMIQQQLLKKKKKKLSHVQLLYGLLQKISQKKTHGYRHSVQHSQLNIHHGTSHLTTAYVLKVMQKQL